MADKSLNIIATSSKMMADSARAMESLMDDMESAISTQNSILGAFVDSLDQMIKKMNGGGGAAGGDKGGKGNSAMSMLKGMGSLDKNTGDNLKTVGEGLVIFSKGMTDFAKMALKLMLVPDKLFASVTNLITKLSDKLSTIDGKKMKEGAEGLSTMASAVAFFGLVMALAAPVYLIAAMGALIIIPVVSVFAYVFSLIGKAAPAIDAGAKAVAWMGLAIATFGLALWITKALVGGDWKSMAIASLIVVGALALFSFAFYIIGGYAEPIMKGAKAVAWMGLAIIALGIGLGLFQAFDIGFGTILIAAAAVAILGISFGIAGMFGAFIQAGAIPLAMAGLSLVVLAFGLGAFRLFGIETQDYLNAAGAVIAVGGAMVLAGFMSIFIFLGAIALIFASVALITLAGGLTVMNAVYLKAMYGILAPSYSDPKKTNLDLVIGGVVSAMSINIIDSIMMGIGAVALIFASIALITLAGGLFVMNALYMKAMDGVLAPYEGDTSRTQLDHVVSSVVSAFSINLIDTVLMIVGAVALILASVAMITLAGGIFVFNKVYEKTMNSSLFEQNKSNPDVTNFEHTLDAIIGGMVMGPFDLIGLYAAVPAWILAGIGLITIGSGLAKFANIIEKNIDIDKIGDMVNKILTTVAETLIAVGNGDAIDWDDVEDGIEAVSDVGNVLNSIADGVAKMAELKIPMYDKNGNITSYITIGDKEFDQVSENMKKIIESVVGTLTEIGAGQGEVGWFSKSDGEKGADAIRGIGADLTGIADFVQKAANLSFPIYDANGVETGRMTLDPAMLGPGGSVRQNIIRMITSVTDSLAEIGSGKAAQDGWFVDSDIEKGKESISGVSADLNGIAKMVESVSTIKDFDTVAMNIRRTLILIPDAMLGAAEIIDKNKGKLGKVGDALQQMMQPLGSIIEALAMVVEKNITDKDAATLGNAVTTLISSLSELKQDTSYDSFQQAVEYIERLAGTADPMDRLAKSFEKIAKSMHSFGKAFKTMDKGTLLNSTRLMESLTVFSKANPSALNAVLDKGKLLVQYIYEHAGQDPGQPANNTQPTTTTDPKTGATTTTTTPANTTPTKPGTPVDYPALFTQLNLNMTTAITKAITDISNSMEAALTRAIAAGGA